MENEKIENWLMTILANLDGDGLKVEDSNKVKIGLESLERIGYFDKLKDLTLTSHDRTAMKLGKEVIKEHDYNNDSTIKGKVDSDKVKADDEGNVYLGDEVKIEIKKLGENEMDY